jgi:hypothetical protein
MKKVMLLALVLALFTACKKDDVDPIDNNPPESSPNYFPMTVGSYWVYETYEIDSMGVETFKNMRDSLFIAGDTTIRNHTYYLLKGTKYGSSQIKTLNAYRDSNSYIVSHTGNVLFHPSNFSDTLSIGLNQLGSDSVFWSYWSKMESVPNQVQVPAGTFSSIRSATEFYFSWLPDPHKTRTHYKYYADGVGQLINQFSFANNFHSYFEQRLVRYHIAD